MNFDSVLKNTQIAEAVKELYAKAEILEWKVSGFLEGDYVDKSNDPDFPHGVKPWNVGEQTGKWLREYVIQHKPMRVLEFGTSIGCSALWIGSALIEYDGHLDTVEIFDKKIEVAQHYVAQAGLDHIIKIHHTRAEYFLQSCSSEYPYDMFFFDGEKGKYVDYLTTIFTQNLISKNGAIVMDNVLSHPKKFERVFAWLHEHAAAYNLTWTIHHIEAGILEITASAL